MSSVIFYGAGQNARDNYDKWILKGLNPVCFADSNISKHHTLFGNSGVEILSLLEAIAKYADYELYVTVSTEKVASVYRYLRQAGVPTSKIRHCDFPDKTVADLPSVPVSEEHIYQKLFQVFQALQDDMSRDLFLGRLEYSLTLKQTGLYRAMASEDYHKWLQTKKNYSQLFGGLSSMWKIIKENLPVQRNRLYLLGIEDDEYNWVVTRFLQAIPGLNIRIEGCFMPFSVNKPLEFMGLPVLSEEEIFLNLTPNDRIIIGTAVWTSLSKEFAEKHKQYSDILAPIADSAFPQYFEDDFLSREEHEIFVDVGVLDFRSSIDFVKWAKNYDKIYAFEPAPDCYAKSAQALRNAPELDESKVELVNKGLGSSNTFLPFPVEYHGGGDYAGVDTVDVSVVTLDSFLDGRPVTFVKMDVEGAEMEVLLGMEMTIKTYKPKLAVCIYHKHEDLTEISSYLIGLVPEYKFHIRHYNSNETEEVLFCTI
ncbi:hypothetical protein AGMMS49975_00320 [Clostridia bacterium]|nr:hypothetical protein AGMMS49975_00320 [Clostridia bacterium]